VKIRIVTSGCVQ